MKTIQSITILSLLVGISLSTLGARTLNANAEDMSVREVEALLSKRMEGVSHAQIHDLTTHLFELSSRYEFPVSSILALIQTESRFDKDAVSSVGAIGLMQLMPQTAKFIAQKLNVPSYHSARDLYNPTINVSVGVAYLNYLRGKFGKSHNYLSAYNMGPTKYNRYVARHKSGRPAGVKRYVNNIHKGVFEIRREAIQLAYAN